LQRQGHGRRQFRSLDYYRLLDRPVALEFGSELITTWSNIEAAIRGCTGTITQTNGSPEGVAMNFERDEMDDWLLAQLRDNEYGLSGAGLAFLLFAQPGAGDERLQAGNPRTAVLKPASSPYIDAHVHIDQHDPEGAVQLLLRAMDGLNGAKAFIQTEPYGPDNPARWDAEMILPAVKKHPDKLIALGGGGTLNPMILQSWRTGDSGPKVKREFRQRAEELLREGVSGFGELSTEHLSLPQSPVKDYEYAPADHPLMLLLADIAAEHNVPIDLHMEAVPKDMPMPAEYTAPNPPQLHANIAPFERLLSHNPHAKIVWAHAGSDNIGYRTPELSRRLLQAHPNLYMEIKYDPNFPGKDPPIVDGKLRAEWLKLFSDFPDRFIIGSDQHYDPPATVPLARGQQNALLTDQLPPDLKRKIGMENALQIYGIP
jgi:predicted TIM-barrel fold metal-dependent hydrolase